MSDQAEFAPPILDDLPQDIGGIDGARNGDVTELLADLFVKHHVQATKKAFIRVGLFGGLGQGKTSTWQAASKLAEQNPEIDKKQRGQWFIPFDIALHDPHALEHEIDRLIMTTQVDLRKLFQLFRFWILVLLLLLSFFLLSQFTFFDTNQSPNATWQSISSRGLAFTGALALLWLILRGIANWLTGKRQVVWAWFLPSWLRQRERDVLFGTNQQRFHFLQRPTWLIIDNLDRAAIDQQRAVFRALYKHGTDLPFSVLVCMDEAKFLQSESAPEPPTELLTKAIQLEVRMPGRVPLDASRLAWQMASLVLADKACRGCWKALLHAPECVAGLARGLALGKAISPRYAKRLLNDTNFLHWQLAKQRARDRINEITPNTRLQDGDEKTEQAKIEDIKQARHRFFIQQLASEIANPNDWLATLRIVMLTQAVPGLRRENQAFAQALLTNQTHPFHEFARRCSGGDWAAAEQATAIFAATRHWRPFFGEWQPFLAIEQLPHAATHHEADALWQHGIVATPPDFAIFDHLWSALAALGSGYGMHLLNNLPASLASIHQKRHFTPEQQLDHGSPILQWHRISPVEQHAMRQALVLVADLYCLLADHPRRAWQAVMLLAPLAEPPHPSWLWQGIDLETRRKLLWPALAGRENLTQTLEAHTLRHWLQACPHSNLRITIASLLGPDQLATEARLAVAAQPGLTQLNQLVADFLARNGAARTSTSAQDWPLGAVSDGIGEYWPTLNPQAEDLYRHLTEHLSWWQTHLASKPELASLPNSLHYLLLEDPLLAARLRQYPEQIPALLATLRALFAAPNAPVREWQLGLLQKWQTQMTGQPPRVQRAWRARLFGWLRLAGPVVAQAANAGEAVLILRLMALMLGRAGLRLTGQRLPSSEPQAATLLALLVEQQTWRHGVRDTLWQHVFGAAPRGSLLTGAAPDDWLAILQQTRRLLVRRPTLRHDTLDFLADQLARRDWSPNRKRTWLADIDFLQAGATLPDTLRQHLTQGRTALQLRFDDWMAATPFTDLDVWESWLEQGEWLPGDGLEHLPEPDFLPQLHQRITAVLALAPPQASEDDRLRCRERLLDRANTNRSERR